METKSLDEVSIGMAQVKVGSGFGHDKCNTRPADVLVANWSLGKPAAFDMNDPKCSELGWKCSSLAVETYGCWGAEARETLSRLATRLATPMRCTKSQATAAIYGRLSLTLVRSCARARAGPSLVITG
ncbi:hypothetical protein EMCRGX_G013124 [Ephydatia muelleri]